MDFIPPIGGSISNNKSTRYYEIIAQILELQWLRKSRNVFPVIYCKIPSVGNEIYYLRDFGRESFLLSWWMIHNNFV